MPAENRVHEARKRGGDARAKALGPDKRSEISRRAALARWDAAIPEAVWGSADRPLSLGSIKLDCYVLSTEERVFSQRGMMLALGLTIRGGELEKFIEQARLREYLPPEVLQSLKEPKQFRRRGGGPLVSGYDVTLLIDICTAIIDASNDGRLPKHYEPAKARAEIIIRAVAKVGIIALVDEATGYQDIRRREALQAILDKYLRQEFAKWAKRFPDEFFKELFRLKGWDWEGPGKSGHAVAHIINDLVYARLAPGLLRELRQRNPRDGSGRKRKHHQLLTDDIGLPELERHIDILTHFALGFDPGHYADFKRLVDRALPLQNAFEDLPLLQYGASAEYENGSEETEATPLI